MAKQPQHETVDPGELLKRIAALETQLAEQGVVAKTHEDKVALLARENEELQSRIENADFIPVIGRNVLETYAGKKTVTVRKYDPKLREYKNAEEEHEFWNYLIDLAPCQGTEIRLSGQTLQHGMVYTLDINTLRSVKDIVYRGWWHEEQIKGSQESKFRRQTLPTISAKGGGVKYTGVGQ